MSPTILNTATTSYGAHALYAFLPTPSIHALVHLPLLPYAGRVYGLFTARYDAAQHGYALEYRAIRQAP